MKITPKILIIDDRPDDVKALHSCLISNGYEADAVSDGEAAFKAIAAGDVDLIIISAALRGEAGFNIASRLKSADDTSLIPIIMIVDAAREEDRSRAVKAGCNDLISGSLDKEDVILRVGTAIELSRHRLLLNEKEKFYHVVNNMDNGLIVFDQNMKIALVNDRAREFLAIGPHEEKIDFVNYIQGRFNIIHDGDLVHAMKAGPVAFDLERPETDDTRALILEVRSHSIKNPMKGAGEILAILTDVTEERKEELSKQNFFSLISHKLRTPITVIQGIVALMQDGLTGPITDKQKVYCARISKKLNALNGLVDKLLGFTTIESRMVAIGGELIKVKDRLEGLTGFVTASENDRKIELVIDCVDESVEVKMDKTHFDLVVKNLVENAIKFNDKEAARVNIKACKTVWGVDISVSDNGRGIPPEEMDKIFEKFYQIEKYFTGNVEGAGLGLPIVKRIVGLYGGQIELTSELGKGSTFIVKLPVKE